MFSYFLKENMNIQNKMKAVAFATRNGYGAQRKVSCNCHKSLGQVISQNRKLCSREGTCDLPLISGAVLSSVAKVDRILQFAL